MDNNKKDISELSEKALQGFKKAMKKMVETAAPNEEGSPKADTDGKTAAIHAKDSLPPVED
jgi:hypothetical protein